MAQLNWSELAEQLRNMLADTTEATRCIVEVDKRLKFDKESKTLKEECESGLVVIPEMGCTFFHLEEVCLFCKYHKLLSYITIGYDANKNREIIKCNITK